MCFNLSYFPYNFLEVEENLSGDDRPIGRDINIEPP
jgi:hypothetical protein